MGWFFVSTSATLAWNIAKNIVKTKV